MADLVAVQWSGDAHAVRLRRDRAAPWIVLGADHGDRPSDHHRHTSEPVWIRGAKRIEIEISGRASHIDALLLESRSSSRDALRTRPRTLSNARAALPAIIPRTAWGADESIRARLPIYAPAIRFAVIHHTAGTNDYTVGGSAAIVRGIYQYHVLGNGWNDIGYNFLIDRYGQVFEGRAGGIERAVVGAHALGFNFGSVGIALIGDFASTMPTTTQLDALEMLLIWRLDIDHVDPASLVSATSAGNPEYASGAAVALPTICGHRQTGYTDCPGSTFFPELSALRATVASAPVLRIYEPLVLAPDPAATQGPVRFSAQLSGPESWRVRILDPSGAPVWEATGSGAEIDARWNGLTAAGNPAPPASLLGWRIDAGPTLSEALPATGRLFETTAESTQPESLGADPLVLVPADDGGLNPSDVRWHQKTDALVTALVVDVAGCPLATLASQVSYAAGDHALTWPGTDSTGAVAPSGHYAYSITIEPATAAATQLTYPVDVRRTAASLAVTPLVSPNRDGRLDHAVIRFTRLEPGPIDLRVLHGARLVASIAHDSDGALGVTKLAWNPSDLDDGSYIVQLIATTPGGLLELRAPLTITTRKPTLRLRSTRQTTAHFYLLVTASTALFWSARAGRRRIARGRIPAGHHAIRLPRAALRGHRHLTLLASNDAGTRTRPLTIRTPPPR